MLVIEPKFVPLRQVPYLACYCFHPIFFLFSLCLLCLLMGKQLFKELFYMISLEKYKLSLSQIVGLNVFDLGQNFCKCCSHWLA